MRLNEMLNNILSQNTTNVSSAGQNVVITSQNNISAQIQALVPGQILQGEVVETTGDVVKLLLQMNGENVSIQAKLDQNVAVSIGKNLLFQVKNNGSTLSLSPLLENMAMGETAAKALESASLPLNETTVNMTTTLMQEGMPINKEALQGIYQEVLANTNAELMDIIDLHKLNLPVTPENIEQMHAYKEMNHQISGGVEQMANDLLQLVQDMAGKGQEKSVAPMLQEILQIVDENIAANEPNQVKSMQQSIAEGNERVVIQENSMAPSDNTVSGTSIQDTEVVLERLETLLQNENVSVPGKSSNDNTLDVMKQLLQLVNDVSGDKEALAKILNSDVFSKAINKFMQERMLLETDAVANKEKVQDFYQKITKQLSGITEVLQNLGQEQSTMAKTVQNMSQNVNFLNQMNQMYAYVQLPIRLSENNAHGELYVYSNKKHMASKDGEVSALLHLDMEHLGPVDVYVQMKDANVSTRFYLKDDEMLDFINDHIEILTKRLEKRGYKMSCQMTVREENSDGQNVIMNELLNENSNRPALVSYSFDVRA